MATVHKENQIEVPADWSVPCNATRMFLKLTALCKIAQ